MAWPSMSRSPATSSPADARNICSRLSTSHWRSWLEKKLASASTPSKMCDSCSTNSFCPPPNSRFTRFGRCSSSAAFSKLTNKMVKSHFQSTVYETKFLGKMGSINFYVVVCEKKKPNCQNLSMILLSNSLNLSRYGCRSRGRHVSVKRLFYLFKKCHFIFFKKVKN